MREVPLKSGRCDYLLLVDRKPVGVVEAKKEGVTLSGVAEQSGHYAANLPEFLAAALDGGVMALTATPAKQPSGARWTGRKACPKGERGGVRQTVGFFNQNLAMEPSGARQTAIGSPEGQRGGAGQYSHERAVVDGVNVGYEVYRIKTRVGESGGTVEKGFYVDRRHKATRSKRQEQLDKDLAFTGGELDCGKRRVIGFSIQQTRCLRRREQRPRCRTFRLSDEHEAAGKLEPLNS